jgi:hypothetical protein
MSNAEWFGRPAVFWLTLGAAAMMVVGGFGPWAKVFSIASVSGTDGDGWFLIVGGLAACGLLAREVTAGGVWPLAVILLIGIGCAVVAFIDLDDIAGVAGEEAFGSIVDPGWGIYASLIGSVALAASAALALVWRPYPGRGDTPPPSAEEVI